jgi:hypothetical protein
MKLLGQIAISSFLGGILLLLIGNSVFGQEYHVNLRDWSYKPRDGYKPVFQAYSPTVAIGPGGLVAVGFVTKDRTGLATRALPPLSFHIVEFNRQGEFLGQHVVPTSTWNQNGLYFGANGRLLVRTAEKLRLFSVQFELIAERDLKPNSSAIRWEIFPLPDRSSLLVYSFQRQDTAIELLSSADLTSLKRCSFDPLHSILSVSDRLLLARLSSPSNDPLLQEIIVRQVCGDVEYKYSWHKEPSAAFLVGDTGLLLAGYSSQIRFLSAPGTNSLWQDSFDKHDHVTDHVEVSADGKIFAVAVKTFTGGNRSLDISSHLKRERVVVYRSGEGKRIKEVSVHLDAPSVFGFSLSSDGDLLAIVADENLDIIPIN